jgi:enoyl-CoA hydratase/carnithine racemase
VRFERHGPIAVLTINRPHAANAFGPGAVGEFRQHLATIRADASIAGVVVTGAGDRHFCSGGDVKAYSVFASAAELDPVFDDARAVLDELDLLTVPTVAAINGVAIGGGFELALACDFRIAAASARLGDTSLKFSLIPDEGGAYLFPRHMGLSNALKMSLLSEVYPAERAKELGLVNEVVEDAQLMPTARDWALRLAEGPPIAIRVTKRMMYKQLTMDLDGALEDAALGTIVVNYCEDVQEGKAAFREKRKPNFQGR